MISLIRKPKGFSGIHDIFFFNIPLVKKVNSCIRDKIFTQIKVRIYPE